MLFQSSKTSLDDQTSKVPRQGLGPWLHEKNASILLSSENSGIRIAHGVDRCPHVPKCLGNFHPFQAPIMRSFIRDKTVG